MTKTERIQHNRSQIVIAYTQLVIRINEHGNTVEGTQEYEDKCVWLDGLIQSALKRYNKSNDFDHELATLRKIEEQYFRNRV